MENYNENEMVEFAKFAKNFTSPKNPKEALNKWKIVRLFVKRGYVCKTGDRFARVKPDGKIYSVYEMAWCYRSAERIGVSGKYFPSAYNVKTHYMRTPMKGATPYETPIHIWTIEMFLQALRYIPTDQQTEEGDWRDNLYRVTGYSDDLVEILSEFPIPISLFKGQSD